MPSRTPSAEDDAAPPNANTFSLGFLLRATTLICMTLGCLSLIASMPPRQLMAGQMFVELVLASVIAVRRRGTRLAKVKSAVGFLWMACVVACYCGFAAVEVQRVPPEKSAHAWAALDSFFTAALLILGFPLVAILLTLMLRLWTWAAHDCEIAASLTRDDQP